MKLAFKASVHLSSSILCVILFTPQAWAQAAGTAASPTNTTTTEINQSGINPMTGRPLSEEDLYRQLNKSKLITQLGQEQVKQAQNAADLVLANLRADSEKTRARAESLAQMAVSGQSKSGNVTLIKPAPLSGVTSSSGKSAAQKASSTATANPTGSPTSTAPLQAVKASGTIRIGYETIDVASSTPPSSHAQVQWVDSQTRQVARAGSPLSPINVQPATGVLGIPAIPGIMPSPMNSGLGQAQ